MKKMYYLLILIVIILTGCKEKNVEVILKENFYESGIKDTNYVELVKVNDNVWVHTTYIDFNGYRTPANGLVIITFDGLVLVDTPWTNKQTEELIKLSQELFKANYSKAIVTHAHDDNIGGINKLMEYGIEVISTNQTMKEAMKNGFSKPLPKLKDNSTIKIGNTMIETYYPGGGHTSDNIVVWLPEDKLLFGGCLVKSLETKSLGNTKEANLIEWPISINKLKSQYSDIKIVVPGHGNIGDTKLLDHTIKLLGER